MSALIRDGRTEMEELWERDFNRVVAGLIPWARRDGRGFEYVSADAPDGLLSVYRALVSIGYANGWL